MPRTLFLTCYLLVFAQGFAQHDYSDMRSLEKRVKFVAPDSLFFFANQLDTTFAMGKALRHWSLGRGHFWSSDYPRAYQELNNAVSFIDELGDPSLKAELYLDLSASLAVVDKNGRALSYLLEANELLETSGSREQQTRAAISLAEQYRKIGEMQQALEILRETLPKTEDLMYNRARCLHRIAAVQSESVSMDSSLYYSYQALELSGALNDADLIATSENEIGYALRHKGENKASLAHFFKADSLWQSIGRLRYAANPMHHVSIVYRTLHEFDKGLAYTRKAYSKVKGKGWDQAGMNLLEDLKMYHDYYGNEDSVLFYDRERLQAAINFRTKQFEVNTEMVQILFTQKENEQTIREQEVKLENERLEKEAVQRQQITLWVVLFLIGIILLVIFIYTFNQRKLQRQLKLENLEKERKNGELEVALDSNQALVQEISHRVKNNLAVLASLLTMQANRSDSEKVKKELKNSVLRIESIATIHKKLYDKRTDAKVELDLAIKELSRNVVSAMGKDPDTCLKLKLDPTEFDIQEAVTLCLILNEVITNSCKYTPVSEEYPLVVELVNDEKTVNCSVTDHGPGFDEKELNNQRKSLGIYLIHLLAKQLKATIAWNKKETQFEFTIVLNKDE